MSRFPLLSGFSALLSLARQGAIIFISAQSPGTGIIWFLREKLLKDSRLHVKLLIHAQKQLGA